MPALGADMDEGTLLEWLVKPGDEVRKGEVIAVVDTDKAAIEVESFAAGRVERLIVNPGETVPVGTLLATIAEHAAGEVAPEAPPATGRGEGAGREEEARGREACGEEASGGGETCDRRAAAPGDRLAAGQASCRGTRRRS